MTADGKITVDGDANPYDVAKAITRSKKRREARKAAIGAVKAATVRREMAAKLRRRGL